MSSPQQPFQRPMNQPPVNGPRSTSSTFGGWGGSGGHAMPPRPGAGPQGAPPPRPPQAPGGPFPGHGMPPQPGGGPQPYPGPGPMGPPQGPPLPGQPMFAPGWQQPPRPRQRPVGLLIVMSLTAVALVGLLVWMLMGGPSGNYQNEDYEVPSSEEAPPEPPLPRSPREATEFIENSSLYDHSLAAPVRCEVQISADTTSLDEEGLEEYLQSYVGCLTRVWGPSLEEAGFEAYQPSVTVYPFGSTTTTGCGTAEAYNAFYCFADQQLYVSHDLVRVLPEDIGAVRSFYEFVVAHEYGHAVQGRTGILISTVALAKDLGDGGDQSGALELMRRSEVQADCFSAVAVNSLSDSMGITGGDREDMMEAAFSLGDDQLSQRAGKKIEEGDHGTGENRRLWASRGFGTHDLSQCNTYTAPSDEVK